MEPISGDAFVREAKRHFQFLEKMGFGLFREEAVNDSGDVAWVSNVGVYVSVFCLPPSFEIGFRFGVVGVDEEPRGFAFDQGDLVLLRECKDWAWSPADAAVGSYLSEYARLLKTCGRKCLEGDAEIYARMRNTRRAMVSAWNKSEKAATARASAEAAWRKKQYSAALQLYEKMDDSSEIERARLRFLRKRAIETGRS